MERAKVEDGEVVEANADGEVLQECLEDGWWVRGQRRKGLSGEVGGQGGRQGFRWLDLKVPWDVWGWIRWRRGGRGRGVLSCFRLTIRLER